MLDVRTFRGADCGSDHFLVVGKLKVKLKKIEKRREKQTELFDIQKLDDPSVFEDFRKSLINEIYEEHIDYENYDVRSLWSAIRNMIHKTAEKQSGSNVGCGNLGLTRYTIILYNVGRKKGKCG